MLRRRFLLCLPIVALCGHIACGEFRPPVQIHNLSESSSIGRELDSPGYTVQVLRDDSAGLVVEFQIHEFRTQSVSIGPDQYTSISVTGTERLVESGLPAFPFIAKDFLLSGDGNPDVQILERESVDMNLGIPLPSQGEISRDNEPIGVYQFSSFYVLGKSFPEHPLSIGTPFLMNSFRGINIRFTPFIFSPQSGFTRVFKRIRFSVRSQFHNGELMDGSKTKESPNVSFQRIAAAHFVNGPMQVYESQLAEARTGRLRIITTDSFRAPMLRFRDWKSERGMDAEIVTLQDIGGERGAESIYNFIKDDFVKNGLTHVLLVGDAEIVPSRRGTVGNVVNRVSDPSYATVAGDDSYPDVIVSRFSAKNVREVETMVERSIRYEADRDRSADWYRHHLGIASNEETPSDWERMRAVQEILRVGGYEHFTEVFDPRASAATAVQALQQGVGFLNYMGHGVMDRWVTSGFNNQHIARLTNRRWPFIISVACVVGAFSSEIGDSLAEAWLKAGTPEDPYGAVGILASSTTQAWVPPAVGLRRAVELLASGRVDTLGELYTAATIGVLEHNSRDAVQTYQSWHSFGDPTLELMLSR